MALTITADRIGKKLFRLSIYSRGTYIGEYERSQSQDLDRKREEIRASHKVLLRVFSQHGPFMVRWDGIHRRKSVRIAGVEVETIPRAFWRTPSWET